jgi:gamma-glutamyltranspeptidase/glutathione hydrolase
VLTTMTLGQPPKPIDPDAFPELAEVPTFLPAAVTAPKAMVAAAHPLAARIGADVLRAGGNAVDALVAVQLALNVVEPQSSGIGGGCFILYYDAKTGQTHCIDGREEVPAGARIEDFRTPQVVAQDDLMAGGRAAGVPGAVAAMWLAHGQWGKLPMAQVAAPAIRLAEEGVGVTPRMRGAILFGRARFLHFPSSKAAFLAPDTLAPEIGTVLKQPDLGRTFRILAEQGPKAFYEGEIAKDIVAAVQGSAVHPGRMTLADLAAYRAVPREPVRCRYRGHEIVSMPPPSSGGLTLGLMLGMLEAADVARLKPGSLEEIELLVRVSNAAFADRNAYLGDQDWSPNIPMRALLDPGFVQARRAAALAARPGDKLTPGKLPNHSAPPAEGNPNEGQDTTHYSIVDADRNVIACTTTIEHGMGCGLVVPGRGFLLNNQLTDFDLTRTTGPNLLDTSRRPRTSALTDNREPAGKRPRSSMTPVIAFKDGKPVLTAGSPGGSQIIGVVAQLLVNVFDHGMDVQQAINAPRVNSRNGPVAVEAMYPDPAALRQALRARGWPVSELGPMFQTWGGAHGVRIRADGTLEGGADPRREGAVRGW